MFLAFRDRDVEGWAVSDISAFTTMITYLFEKYRPNMGVAGVSLGASGNVTLRRRPRAHAREGDGAELPSGARPSDLTTAPPPSRPFLHPHDRSSRPPPPSRRLLPPRSLLRSAPAPTATPRNLAARERHATRPIPPPGITRRPLRTSHAQGHPAAPSRFPRATAPGTPAHDTPRRRPRATRPAARGNGHLSPVEPTGRAARHPSPVEPPPRRPPPADRAPAVRHPSISPKREIRSRYLFVTSFGCSSRRSGHG